MARLGLLKVTAQTLPPFEEMLRKPAAPPVAPPAEERLRVLVAAADAALRQSLRVLLEQGGYAALDVDAAAGLQTTLQVEPQMLLASGAAGLALTRALRQTGPGRRIYIMLLVPSGEEMQAVEALEAGADDVLALPPSPRLLLARLRAGRRLLRLQEALEHEREELRRHADELAVSNRRLEEVALTDVLTGLPNRRYAMERIEQEWAGATRSGRPLACMVIDLDELKQVNDIYGHDIGDAFLAQTSALIRGALRAQDVLCRTGGDEFLAICPDTDLAAALACAERMRQEVAAQPAEAGQLRIRGTVSVGVAARVPEMEDADALIKQADRGAYLAKQNGRNRVASVQASAPR